MPFWLSSDSPCLMRVTLSDLKEGIFRPPLSISWGICWGVWEASWIVRVNRSSRSLSCFSNHRIELHPLDFLFWKRRSSIRDYQGNWSKSLQTSRGSRWVQQQTRLPGSDAACCNLTRWIHYLFHLCDLWLSLNFSKQPPVSPSRISLDFPNEKGWIKSLWFGFVRNSSLLTSLSLC